jgi:hypothetical protein
MLDKYLQSINRLCRRFSFLRQIFCPIVPIRYVDTSIENSNDVIILPPSDYWVLQTTLAVKTAKEAIKFAPALFDLGEGYRYVAKKIAENRFTLIAYDPLLIATTRSDLLEHTTRRKVTFAQFIFADETHPIRTQSGKYLVSYEGIVTEIDQRYIDLSLSVEMQTLLNDFQKDYPSIVIEKSSLNVFNPKTLKITALILLIILINISIGSYIIYQSTKEINQKKEDILHALNLPLTSIERDTIIDALKRKESRQLQLRAHCNKIKLIPIKASLAAPIYSSKPTYATSAAPSYPKPTYDASTPTTNDVVLIPGSKPGEPNRLLVDGKPNQPSTTSLGEMIRELQYDGKTIKIVIRTNEGENLKKAFLKQFKNSHAEYRDNQLEIRIK